MSLGCLYHCLVTKREQRLKVRLKTVEGNKDKFIHNISFLHNLWSLSVVSSNEFNRIWNNLIMMSQRKVWDSSLHFLYFYIISYISPNDLLDSLCTLTLFVCGYFVISVPLAFITSHNTTLTCYWTPVSSDSSDYKCIFMTLRPLESRKLRFVWYNDIYITYENCVTIR